MPQEFIWAPEGGGGSGDVVGPASATDNAVVRYNGTTGKAVQNSLVTIDDSGNVITPGTVDGRDVSVDGTSLDSHIASTANPHSVTKAQVGLSDVENAAASTLYVPLTQKAAPNGVATLDAGGQIPSAQLPPIAITDTFVVASQAAQLALTAEVGDVAVRTDQNKSYILRLSPASTFANWQELLTPTDAVLSVNSKTGAVSLTTTDIPEGAELYFTDERAQDAVAAALTNSSTVNLTYDDAFNTITATVNPAGIDKNVLGGSALDVANGGTGQTTANAALNALLPTQAAQTGKFLQTDGSNTSWTAALVNPMTDVGDIIYGGTSGATTRLAPNITTTRRFLTGTGTGSAGQTPVWTDLTATLPGSVSGSAIASGYIGEVLTVTNASPQSPGLTDAYKTLVTLSLSPGVWRVEGVTSFDPTGISGYTRQISGISLTTNAMDASNLANLGSIPGGTQTSFVPAGTGRIVNVSATTSVYLVGLITYTSAGSSAFTVNTHMRATRIA